jgi:hypothetical protein
MKYEDNKTVTRDKTKNIPVKKITTREENR